MEKRKLTSSEIEYLISFIELNKDIPLATAKSVLDRNKERLRNQLVSIEIYPSVIESLKILLEKEYNESLINPGQSVGIIAAQSIGERNTQNTLNTFHKAGQSEKSVLAGVPRFQEILNTTKDPKAKSCRIFFRECNYDIKKLRDLIRDSLVEIKLKNIVSSFTIHREKVNRVWYKDFKILYGGEDWFIDFEKDNFKSSIELKIDTDVIYKYKIEYEKIVRVILEKFGGDLSCVFSPDNIGIIDIFVDTSDISLPTNRVGYIDTDNMYDIYIEECVIPEIYKIIICGIEGIENIYYTYNDDGEWYVDTDGSNYRGLLQVPFIDKARSVSNNMWEVYEVLGIEATREFLIRECLDIMESINICHVKLLAERMTFSGTISSISRYTMRTDDSGPMSKASFEESTDNFLRAAYNTELETTDGVSASIICGKKAKNGTGIMDLELDLENF